MRRRQFNKTIIKKRKLKEKTRNEVSLRRSTFLRKRHFFLFIFIITAIIFLFVTYTETQTHIRTHTRRKNKER